MDGITDMTITGVVSAVAEIVADSPDNARIFRDYDGGFDIIISRCCVAIRMCWISVVNHYHGF